MGNLRHLPEGADFTAGDFARESDFGFSGSAQGYDRKGSANPPFAATEPSSGPHTMKETTPQFAEGGPVGGSAHTYAGGGGVSGHPQGHQPIEVTHDPASGAIMHKHAHGGYTMHHPDGGISHHGADGQPAMAARGGDMNAQAPHPGEGTFLERARGGRTAPPAHHKKPAHHAPPKARMDSGEPDADDTAPRNPMRNPSRRNAMPGGQMAYGVEPSAEPDVAGSDQGIAGALGGR